MKKILPFMLIAVFLLAACASARNKSPAAYDMSPSIGVGGGAPSMNEQAAAPMPTAGAVSNVPASADGSAAAANRIVIQNADLTIVVSDVEGRMKNIQTMAQQMGGFVVSSNLGQTYTNNNTQVPEAQITVRVPAEKLDAALEQIKKDVVDVQTENRSGSDVTAEYVDLQSRLKNYEAAAVQLEEIMAKAEKTEDVVNVFNQLVYYREQIEIVKGQIKYYEEAAALSAISVRIIAKETIQPIEIAGWEPQGVARDAIQSLIYFYQGFIEFLINFFLLYLPVCLTLAIPLYLVFLGGRAVFRKLKGPKKEQAVVEEKK